MKTIKQKIQKLALFSLFLFPLFLSAEEFDLDGSHSSVKFTATHLLISDVDGRFRDFDFELDLEDQSIVKLEGEVDVESIDTDNEKRDGHLRSPDFFEEDKYDQIQFLSTRYEKTSKNSGKLYGDVTIKDVKKEVVFEVTMSDLIDFKGKKVVGLKLQTEINRKDFNVGSDFPTAVVSDPVLIKIDLQFKR